MAFTASPELPAEMNAVICIFNIDKEGFNGVSLIKTDIYYRLGWLWFAATSKWTRDYGRTRSTFQNKPQVSLSVLSPQGSSDPRSSFISLWLPGCSSLDICISKLSLL